MSGDGRGGREGGKRISQTFQEDIYVRLREMRDTLYPQPFLCLRIPEEIEKLLSDSIVVKSISGGDLRAIQWVKWNRFLPLCT